MRMSRSRDASLSPFMQVRKAVNTQTCAAATAHSHTISSCVVFVFGTETHYTEYSQLVQAFGLVLLKLRVYRVYINQFHDTLQRVERFRNEYPDFEQFCAEEVKGGRKGTEKGEEDEEEGGGI